MIRKLALASIALVPVMAGCSSASPGSEPTEQVLLDPPAKGEGIQLRMVTELGPGVEGEHCQFVKAPPEGLLINRDLVRYSKGSHHFLLFETPYKEIPTKNFFDKEVDTRGVFDCSDGVPQNWQTTRIIAGSQNANGESIIAFPSDVAIRIPGSAVLLMNAHYINTSAQPLKPEVRLNLYTISESQMKHEGDVLFLYNIFIKAPAQSASRARMGCTMGSDITLTSVQSHMHARGVKADITVGGKSFYSTTAWSDVPVTKFANGFPINKGSVIDYWCDYQNNGMNDVFQGPRTTDEMCAVIGSYYPIDRPSAACASDAMRPQITQNLGAEWQGQGKATCAETAGCLQKSSNVKGFNEFQRAMSECVSKSDPAVSKEVSASMRCLVESLIDKKDPLTACSAQFGECLKK